MTEQDPRLDPAEIRAARFPGNSRRYEAKAVDQFLAAVAERVVEVNAFVDDLHHRIRELERSVRDAETSVRSVDLSTFSEDEIVRFVGEETATVLATARRAAEEIRSKAEESASRMIREATAEAKAERDRAWAEVGELRVEAQEARDRAVENAERETTNIRREAQSEAERVIAEAHARAASDLEGVETQRQQIRDESAQILVEARDEGRAMVNEAKELRARVLEDLQRRREAGRDQIDALLDGRDRLLAALEGVGGELAAVMSELRAALPDTAFSSPTDDVDLGGDEVPDAEDVVDLTEDAAPAQEGDEPALLVFEDDEEADAEQETDADVAVEAGVDADLDVDDDTRAPVAPVETSEEPEPETAAGEAEVVEVVEAAEVDEVDEVVEVDEVDVAATPASTDVDRVPAELLAPDGLLESRNAAFDQFGATLAKSLKRQLADEQNEVLDLLRRSERAELRELFADEESHVATYSRLAHPVLTAVAAAGAAVVHGGDDLVVDVADLAWALGAQLVEPFRRKVERVIDEVDGDPDEVDERLRALYREWKATQIEAASEDALLSAFSVGTYEAAPDDAALLWLIDPAQGPCSDALDNALAGATTKGEPFPTGDDCPQAHPGCRCLLVCAEAEESPR